LDGEVYAVDECYSPIDRVEDAQTRAQALKAIVDDRAIAERDSALWIYGIRLDPPARHTLCVPREHRATVAGSRRFVVRETRLRSGDTRRVGGLLVTTPLRTAFDLVRETTFDTADRDAVVALFARFDVDVAACRHAVQAIANLPGRRAALERLDTLAGQPALTRYTS